MTAASGPAPANVVAVQPVYCGGFTVTLHSGYLIRALTMGGGGDLTNQSARETNCRKQAQLLRINNRDHIR